MDRLPIRRRLSLYDFFMRLQARLLSRTHMHTLGLIFAWILVIMFGVGYLGSALIALEGLWNGFACFFEKPTSPSRAAQLQPHRHEIHV